MELILGYGAGLLTLINPCVLPILPIVLATALQAGRHGPLAIAAGMSLSFVVLGLGVTVVGYSLGITEETIAQVGAILMVGFGLVLLVPRFSAGFATATAGFSTRADAQIDDLEQGGMRGQFLAGILLGAVWSPCIGPTLGGAISLASQGESIAWAAAVILRRQATMRAIAGKARPIMGVVFVAVGLGILFKVHHLIDAWALQVLPVWLVDLSVSI